MGYGSGSGNLSSQASEARRTGGAKGEMVSMDFEPSPETLSAAFEQWAYLIKDMRPVWTDVINKFKAHESFHLRTEGVATGDRFAELSEPYRRWKDNHFPGKPILTLRGAMRLALTKGGPGWTQKISKDGVSAGINPSRPVGKYASAPAFGKNNMPIRPPVRYDPSVHTAGLKKIAAAGGQVPFGTAVAQLFQIYIVAARKQAFAEAKGVWVDGMDQGTDRKRRGVLALRTR